MCNSGALALQPVVLPGGEVSKALFGKCRKTVPLLSFSGGKCLSGPPTPVPPPEALPPAAWPLSEKSPSIPRSTGARNVLHEHVRKITFCSSLSAPPGSPRGTTAMNLGTNVFASSAAPRPSLLSPRTLTMPTQETPPPASACESVPRVYATQAHRTRAYVLPDDRYLVHWFSSLGRRVWCSEHLPKESLPGVLNTSQMR